VSRTRAAFLQRVNFKEILPELGEGELGSPDLSFVFQTVSADESQSKIERVKIWSRGISRHCEQHRRKWLNGSTTTYSLISFSFSKGLLGVVDVFASKERRC
jgi:hypothetical protein